MKISGIGWIYMITSPSNRRYVGSAIDIDLRWDRYKRLDCKNQTKLYRSFNKYGVDKHNFEIIWAGDINDMLKYESMIGIYYNCLNTGLNCNLPKLSQYGVGTIWQCDICRKIYVIEYINIDDNKITFSKCVFVTRIIYSYFSGIFCRSFTRESINWRF